MDDPVQTACCLFETDPCCLQGTLIAAWLVAERSSDSRRQPVCLAPCRDQGCLPCPAMMTKPMSTSTRLAAPCKNSSAMQADTSAAPAAGPSSTEGNASDVSGLLIGGTLVPDQLMHGVVVILTPDGSLGEVDASSCMRTPVFHLAFSCI